MGKVNPEPNKLMLAGDWHGNTAWMRHVIARASAQDVDTILHLGDFGRWVPGVPTQHFLAETSKALTEAGITLYWVAGNHEFWPHIVEYNILHDYQPWVDEFYPHENIVHLPNGFRWTWWNKTWLALGGAHSVDRLARKAGLDWWDEEHITDADCERAIAGGPVDIMVTHDCPTGVDIPGIHSDPEIDALKGFFPKSEILAGNEHRKKLATVVDAVRPKMLFTGHYHCRHTAWRRESDTIVNILDCDSTSIAANTLVLNRD